MQNTDSFSPSYWNRDTAIDYNITDDFSNITKKIKQGELKIAVYGLGHVGSPIAEFGLELVRT